jgi:hypothetical protein
MFRSDKYKIKAVKQGKMGAETLKVESENLLTEIIDRQIQ